MEKNGVFIVARSVSAVPETTPTTASPVSASTGARRLLIDAGNSRMKWIEATGRQLIPATLGQCANGETINLETPVPDVASIDEVLVVSVAALDGEQRIRESFPGLRAPIHWLRSQATHSLLVNAYDEPHKLGVDRWAAMAGCRINCTQAFCVADLGTATTLDAVTADGTHLGGWILPGLGTSRAALRQKGHLLAQATEGSVMPLARNTADAISSGTAHAQAATIHAFIQQMQTHGIDQIRLFVTGGFAQSMLGLLSYEAVFDPLLIFRGMLALHDT